MGGERGTELSFKGRNDHLGRTLFKVDKISFLRKISKKISVAFVLNCVACVIKKNLREKGVPFNLSIFNVPRESSFSNRPIR